MRSLDSKIWREKIEPYRLHTGEYGSDSSYGNDGVFFIMVNSIVFKVICSDGLGWDHVSVSSEHGTPLWNNMHKIKRLFFTDHEVVMQLHPAESDYVNMCESCLHLWRPQHQEIPVPDIGMV